MPELPDVEVFRQMIHETSLGKKVEHSHIPKTKVLNKNSPQKLAKFLKGHQIEGITRHGKHLFFKFSDHDELLTLHFGMTGKPVYHEQKDKIPNHSLLSLDFEDQHRLNIVMQRKLGEIDLTNSLDEYTNQHGLGPDFMNLPCEDFITRFQRKKGRIKSALMDQSVVSGLGNVYSDEVLFQAGIDPDSSTSALSEAHLKNLWQEAQKVLKEAIVAKADPEKMRTSFLTGQRHEKGHCPKCQKPISTKKIGGRKSYYCSDCQSVIK